MTSSYEHRYVTAVLFILLLAGAEGARVRSHVALKAKQTASSDAEASSVSVASSGSDIAFGGGRDVCRLRDFKSDPASVLPRYKQKMQALKEASEKLNDQPYSGKQWIKVTRRLKRLTSCARMMQSKYAEDIPKDLRSIMMHGEDQLEAGLLSPRAALTKVLDEYQSFPRFEELPDCQFNLIRLNLEDLQNSSSPEEALRHQLFGEECSLQDAKDYIDGLSGKSRRIAKTMHNQLLKVMKLRQTLATGTPDSHEVKVEAEQMMNAFREDLEDIAEDAAAMGAMDDDEEPDDEDSEDKEPDDEDSEDKDDVLGVEDLAAESRDAEEKFLATDDNAEIEKEMDAEEEQLLELLVQDRPGAAGDAEQSEKSDPFEDMTFPQTIPLEVSPSSRARWGQSFEEEPDDSGENDVAADEEVVSDIESKEDADERAMAEAWGERQVVSPDDASAEEQHERRLADVEHLKQLAEDEDDEELDEDGEDVIDSLLEVSAPKKKKHGSNKKSGSRGSHGKKRTSKGKKSHSKGEKRPSRPSRPSRASRGSGANRRPSRSSRASLTPMAPPKPSGVKSNKQGTSSAGGGAGNFLRIAVVILCLIAILTVLFLFVLEVFAVVNGVTAMWYGPSGGLLYTTSWLR